MCITEEVVFSTARGDLRIMFSYADTQIRYEYAGEPCKDIKGSNSYGYTLHDWRTTVLVNA